MNKKYKGQLVCQHLEGISSAVFEKHQTIIKNFIKGRHGVYALYHHNKLYYVGLARDMKNRLGQHLKDKHANKWNSFSIYLTIGDEHLKELESLILRIASPSGNNQGGGFTRSEDLKRNFRRQIINFQKRELYGLFDEEHKSKKNESKSNKQIGSKCPLAKYFKKRAHLRCRYKGKAYIAHVLQNGTITLPRGSADWKRLGGKVFKSPSEAATAITKRPMNGWRHWKYERSPGEWVLIDELRK